MQFHLFFSLFLASLKDCKKNITELNGFIISKCKELKSMSAHVKIIISFTKEFLNFRHWSRNTKFCGKSWELHYYQTSYWGFCGKHSQCGILMRALKQIYLKSIKAFRASSSLCLPYRDTDRGISTRWISYLYIVHSFQRLQHGTAIHCLFCWTLASIVSPSITTDGMQGKWGEKWRMDLVANRHREQE